MKHRSNKNSGKLKKAATRANNTRSTSGGELHQIQGGLHASLTSNQGTTIADNQNSLRGHSNHPVRRGCTI